MKELVQYLAKSLVNNPDAVEVKETEGETASVLELKVAKEDLGTRNIEGVDCTGTLTTTTIPAGAIGNEKPISIVRETWYAPAIAAVVESTTEDPRYGKTTYQLTNVQLSEPSRSLFEPPGDLKISVRK